MANSEDPDNIPQYAMFLSGSALFVKIKNRFGKRRTPFHKYFDQQLLKGLFHIYAYEISLSKSHMLTQNTITLISTIKRTMMFSIHTRADMPIIHFAPRLMSEKLCLYALYDVALNNVVF